ncbi:MAG: hypothetical protein ACKOXO_09365 [Cyanobium sp.]
MKVRPRPLAPALLLVLLTGCLSGERLRPDVPPMALQPPLRKQVLQGWMPPD